MWLPKPSTSLPVYRTMPMNRSILNFDLNHFSSSMVLFQEIAKARLTPDQRLFETCRQSH